MKRVSHTSPEVQAIGMSEKDASIYKILWVSPDGEVHGLHQLMFHWTVHTNLDALGHSGRYCFDTDERAMAAFDAWDGSWGTDPEGWHKHPPTRRCRDIETGEEWMDGEKSPRHKRAEAAKAAVLQLLAENKVTEETAKLSIVLINATR